MDFLIVTGLSGAGKTQAAHYLEDLGYYCVDNMPSALLRQFAEFCIDSQGRFNKVALVADVRARESFDALFAALEGLKELDCTFRILFIEAPVAAIVRRYKESRRRPPLAEDGMTIEDAVKREIELLRPVRERADYIIDTGGTTLAQLHNEICRLLAEKEGSAMPINVIAFGYKYGIPLEADLVLDVRFLPNPFYVDELREKSGLDLPVKEYVFSFQQTRTFMEQLEAMLEFLLPLYVEEGKLSLTVAIGCTGGRHRSVAIAAALNDYFCAKGLSSTNINRDVEK